MTAHNPAKERKSGTQTSRALYLPAQAGCMPPTLRLVRSLHPAWSSQRLLFPLKWSGKAYSARSYHALAALAGHVGNAHSDCRPPNAHQPVLLSEVVEMFANCSLSTFVDATIGAGGHSTAILQAHPEITQLIGMDVDPNALNIARTALDHVVKQRGAALTLLQANFASLQHSVLQQSVQAKATGVDGILLDVGVSSMQLDTASRGFSFQKDGPLDMRMGPSAQRTAADIVNTFPEVELGEIFRDLGEERHWRTLARRICEARLTAELCTTQQLLAALRLPRLTRSSRGAKKRLHPATRAFQVRLAAVCFWQGCCIICLIMLECTLITTTAATRVHTSTARMYACILYEPIDAAMNYANSRWLGGVCM